LTTGISAASYQKNNQDNITPDFIVVDKLGPLDIDQDIEEAIALPPSDGEITCAIKKLKLGKAPGITGVTMDMRKAQSYIAHAIR
jgi:hypothetical protein